MNYDSSGVNYMFESAGMLELLAEQNGEPLVMNPEKEIDIEMSSNNDSKAFNLYEFDEFV